MAFTLYKEVIYAADAIPDGDLSGFPVPVWITADADIAAELAGGGGIKFTSADGLTDLPFGLYPSTNLAAGTVHGRVKIDPDADASVGNVSMRLYYSATESTTEDKAGTVDNGYELFMPLEEDPSGSAPQMLDWVTETNVGTSAGTMTSGDSVAATVGNGLDFDGSDDSITTPDAPGLDFSAGTVEAIISTSAANAFVNFLNRDDIGSNRILQFRLDNAEHLQVVWFDASGVAVATGAVDIVTGSPHHVASTYSGGSVVQYVDGSQDGTATGTAPLATGAIGFTSGAGNGQFTGIVDEVRISSVARSADWLAYAYTTDFNKADLWTLGAEQGGGGGGGNRRRRVLLGAR